MTTYKRIDGDYNIVSINATDNVIVDTNTLVVLGNLDVEGNLTYINVTELNVKDPFILLNASNTGSYASNSGVLTHTAVSTFAGIRFDASANLWELNYGDTDSTGLTGTWAPISSGGSIGGALLPGDTDDPALTFVSVGDLHLTQYRYPFLNDFFDHGIVVGYTRTLHDFICIQNLFGRMLAFFEIDPVGLQFIFIMVFQQSLIRKENIISLLFAEQGCSHSTLSSSQYDNSLFQFYFFPFI